MTSTTKTPYAGHRFPPELISYTVWLYYRFPLSLRMVEEMLAFRGIEVSHETIRQWGLKFGQEFANIIHRRLPRPGDKWHLDEVVLKIAGKKHYLWRAVDQHGVVLDVLVQRRRDKTARIWSTGLDDILHQLCTGHSRNLSLGEWRRYLGDLPWQPTCESWPTPTTPKD